MRSASLLLYLSLSAPQALAAGSPATTGQASQPGPYPNYLQLHARTRGFQLGRPQRATPTPDGKQVLFLRATAESPELRLYEYDVVTKKTRELLTPAAVLQGAAEAVSHEEEARRERMPQRCAGSRFELSPTAVPTDPCRQLSPIGQTGGQELTHCEPAVESGNARARS